MVWHDRILISLRLSLSFPHPEINADHKQYMTNIFICSVLKLQQNATQKRPRYKEGHYAVILHSYYTGTQCIPAFTGDFAVTMLGMARF